MRKHPKALLGRSFSISIIIPAFNEEKFIARCLASIVDRAPSNLLEIIVVDNASSDCTSEIASKYAMVRVVPEPQKGITFARARGMGEARGDVLAFIDADVQIPDGWFERLNAAFTANPSLACYSGPYKYTDLSVVQSLSARAFFRFIAIPTYSVTRFMALGGNFAARRKALEKIGGFDTSIAFYGEDTNIARRLYSAGDVWWDHKFFVYTSSRRFQAQGLLTVSFTYFANYLSEAVLHRPITHKYSDIR
jgi:glycosyltransferase involved in cell wall biosynthesis